MDELDQIEQFRGQETQFPQAFIDYYYTPRGIVVEPKVISDRTVDIAKGLVKMLKEGKFKVHISDPGIASLSIEFNGSEFDEYYDLPTEFVHFTVREDGKVLFFADVDGYMMISNPDACNFFPE